MNGAWPTHDTLPTSNGFPPEATFDPSMLNAQFQNPSFQQPRSQTPSSANFPYTPQQLVPSKRPRDDGPVPSPRQPPSNLSLSRSQTPQQSSFPGGNFPNNNNQQGGQALPPPNAYQHLQHGGSNNATPSPTLSNQQYRPPPQQQPGMVMSPPPDGSNGRGTPQNHPHPQPQPQFSMSGQMAAQMGGPQMGGPQMGGPQMGGPQMGGQNFNMPGTAMPQGFNQNFANMQNMGAQANYPQVQLTPNLAQRQAALHQMGMQRGREVAQQRQAAMNNAAMHQAAAPQNNMGTPTRAQGPAPNMQNSQRAVDERAFVAKVASYMQQLQRPFEPQPLLAGRPISLYILFHLVMKGGFSKRITQMNQWPAMARQMGFPPEQLPNAGAELHQIFERNLGQWEAAYYNQLHNKARLGNMQQAQMAGMPPNQHTMSPNRQMTPGGQNNPAATQQYMAQLQQRMSATQAQQSPAPGQMTPQKSNASLPTANGWSTPQPDSAGARPPSAVDQHKKTASRQVDGSPAQVKEAFATPPPIKPPPRMDQKDVNGMKSVRVGFDPRDTTNYVPYIRHLVDPTPYGGILVDKVAPKTIKASLHELDIPGLRDLGVLDIQAVTLSLQSGIAAEVRYALDILVKLTDAQSLSAYVELEACDDLLEVLLDCADDQIACLIDGTEEVADIEFNSYEETTRLAKLEIQNVQDVPVVGSKEYNNDRAAERLIAITSILRNLSFPRHHLDQRRDNAHMLAASRAVKFFSNAIRLLGTRVFLRSHLNVQDFMKDTIIFLSNVAAMITLPSEEDAYNFLQFILAFAPGPNATETKPFRFTPFKPAVHKYYPAAIDAFAKLLARDEPNRTYFKQLFVNEVDADATHVPVYQQYELLTRAFGMAIAVVPDVSGHERKPLNRMDEEILAICQARKPMLSQGMLTADILSALVPTSHPGLAKAWLRTPDSWGCMLFRVVSELAEHDGAREVIIKNQSGGHLPPQLHRDEHFLQTVFISIVSRALSMLKRLAKRALDDTTRPIVKKVREHGDEGTADKVNGEDASANGEETAASNEDALLDDLADMESSTTVADFLPLSDSIFYGIFANTKELTSGVIADYIALGEILH